MTRVAYSNGGCRPSHWCLDQQMWQYQKLQDRFRHLLLQHNRWNLKMTVTGHFACPCSFKKRIAIILVCYHPRNMAWTTGAYFDTYLHWLKGSWQHKIEISCSSNTMLLFTLHLSFSNIKSVFISPNTKASSHLLLVSSPRSLSSIRSKFSITGSMRWTEMSPPLMRQRRSQIYPNIEWLCLTWQQVDN